VSDWQLSKHSQNDVDCSTCHGDAHQDPYDVANAKIPTQKPAANVTLLRSSNLKAVAFFIFHFKAIRPIFQCGLVMRLALIVCI